MKERREAGTIASEKSAPPLAYRAQFASTESSALKYIEDQKQHIARETLHIAHGSVQLLPAMCYKDGSSGTPEAQPRCTEVKAKSTRKLTAVTCWACNEGTTNRDGCHIGRSAATEIMCKITRRS